MAISSFLGGIQQFWMGNSLPNLGRPNASKRWGRFSRRLDASTASRLAEMLEDFDFRGGKTAHFCTVNQCKSLVLAGMTLQKQQL